VVTAAADLGFIADPLGIFAVCAALENEKIDGTDAATGLSSVGVLNLNSYRTIPRAGTVAPRRTASIRNIIEFKDFAVSRARFETPSSPERNSYRCGLRLSEEPHEENRRDILFVGLSKINPYKRMLVIFAPHIADMSNGRDQRNGDGYPCLA